MKRARNEKEEPAARAKRKREEEEYHSLVTWGLDIEQQLEEEIVEGSGYDQLTLPTLPRDVLLRVLSYLGVSDLCSVAVACKALRGAANDGEVRMRLSGCQLLTVFPFLFRRPSCGVRCSCGGSCPRSRGRIPLITRLCTDSERSKVSSCCRFLIVLACYVQLLCMF